MYGHDCGAYARLSILLCAGYHTSISLCSIWRQCKHMRCMQVTGILGVAHLAGSTYIAAFCWTLLFPIFYWTLHSSPVRGSSSEADVARRIP